MTAAGPWIEVAHKPPLHASVLIRIKGGAGFVADVACYAGKVKDGNGGMAERWILSDVHLDGSQITHWAELFDIDAEPKQA